jgi:quinoprotein glucose dehydrogenase
MASVGAKLLGDAPESVAIAASAALEANDAKAASPHLLALVQNMKASPKARLAALDTLAKFATPEFTTALTAAAADANASLKTEAAKLLGKRDPKAAAQQLAAAFGTAAIAEKKQILNALGDIENPASGEALSTMLGELAKVPGEVQLELFEAAAKRPESKAALAKVEAARPADDPLAKYAFTLTGGDASVGEKLFKEHPVAACLRCHKVGGQGGDAGPALDGIAKKKDRRYILESIINVNAVIAEGFQMQIITTTKGETVAGLLKSESADAVVLQNPGTPAVTIKKADIKQRENAPSGMLPGLGDLLSRRELRDVVEYVARLK